MNVISNILYWISTGLLVPVIVLLIFFFARAIFMMGSFFGQYLMMKKTSADFEARVKGLSPENLAEFRAWLESSGKSLVGKCALEILSDRDNPARAELTLDEYEQVAEQSLSSSKMLAKMGPILGLMGTLIPMGPALVGLATGDIASMAYNMQVAFATTVVGLVVSAVGFSTQQARERWFVKNLSLLEYVAGIAKQSGSNISRA